MAEKVSTLATIDPKFIINRQGKDAPLYAGLLDAAHRSGIKRIAVSLIQAPTKDNDMTAICHATVEMSDGRIHEDIGDANPVNVGKMIAMHIIRMAATRAKARALRDALNVNGTALEEYGPDEDEAQPARSQPRTQAPTPIRQTTQAPVVSSLRAGPPVQPAATQTPEEMAAYCRKIVGMIREEFGEVIDVPADMTPDVLAEFKSYINRTYNAHNAKKNQPKAVGK